MYQKIAKLLLRYLFVFETGIAILSYALITGMLTSDVLMREIFGSSLRGVQRISVFFMIQAGFLGLGIAAARGRHLRPRFADWIVADRYVASVKRIGSFLMAGIFALFAVSGVYFVLESIEYGEMARIIEIPMWIVQSVVPYALGTTALRYLLYGIFPQLCPEEGL